MWGLSVKNRDISSEKVKLGSVNEDFCFKPPAKWKEILHELYISTVKIVDADIVILGQYCESRPR
jgi:hypothetical protein